MIRKKLQRNANQNHYEVPFTPVRMAAIQKSTRFFLYLDRKASLE